MTEIDITREKRRRVLERLRGRIADETRREPESDLHNFGAMLSFIHVAPDDESEDDLDEIKNKLSVFRQHRQKRSMAETSPVAETARDSESDRQDSSTDEISGFANLIQELPHIRHNLGAWLGGMEGEHDFGNTSLEELERLRLELKYRLNMLNIFAKATARELDALNLHIQAGRQM
ncbi:MAG: hypothetical protein KJO08_02205 [Gammaproteobacteria bacterium]|nr:hypothetical protein [Gammaproteobacteria bacterium]NNJ84153.1 hypothetical protein [Gammaproteobacteria bacterium]